jgi:hypothetical protein
VFSTEEYRSATVRVVITYTTMIKKLGVGSIFGVIGIVAHDSRMTDVSDNRNELGMGRQVAMQNRGGGTTHDERD